MENKKMTIGLFSGSIDRLTAAGVLVSGAAADDMDIEIYVLMQGARVFLKGVGDKQEDLGMSEYPELKDEFLTSLKNLNVMPWMDFFRASKELANVKIYVCGLAGKVWGGEEVEDFDDLVDDIVGIGECLTSMEESDIHLFI